MEIIPYRKEYETSVVNICFETGYFGEDLSRTKIFPDQKLFGLLFCLYYLNYEPENAFVCLLDGEVVGYIIGTTDTERQEKLFSRYMVPRIILRLITVTLWRHRKSVGRIFFMYKQFRKLPDVQWVNNMYPSHFHINLSSKVQRRGIGSALLKRFEKHLLSSNSKGVHLKTSELNKKALQFYEKHHYEVLLKYKGTVWDEDTLTYVLGKQLIE